MTAFSGQIRSRSLRAALAAAWLLGASATQSAEHEYPPPAPAAPAQSAAPAASDAQSAAPGAQPASAISEAAPPSAPPSASPAAETAGIPAETAPAQATPAPSATPARAAPVAEQRPRQSLVPLVKPLWSDLTPTQQQVLEPFASQWNVWPAQEKRTWMVLADRIPRMKPDQQARARERIEAWAALTPEQRLLARRNYRLAKELPKDERVAQWERYQQMTPDQRAVLRASGWTSNTAARHAGASTGLAKEAAQPLAPTPPRRPATGTPAQKPGAAPQGKPTPASAAPYGSSPSPR